MKVKVKVALIGGVFLIAATVISSIVSLITGKSEGENQTMREENEAFVAVPGDNNVVMINGVGIIADKHEDKEQENEQIEDLNTQGSENADGLNRQADNMPAITYRNLGLSLDGEDIGVNSTNAMVIINDREYISKEIVEKLVGEDRNVLYRDEKMYIGHIVADKANLLEQWNVNMSACERLNNVYDSFGNKHSDVLQFANSSSQAVYNLNREYTMLKFSVAVDENVGMDYAGVLTIKADDRVVYTSADIKKTTEPYTISDIAIDNCSLLTIEHNTSGVWGYNCLIYDASVYN